MKRFRLDQNFTLNEKLSIKNGVMALSSHSFSQAYFALFAISVLGANNHQVALLSSLPALFGMFAMIPGTIWLNRLTQKKKFTALSVFSTRFFLFLMIFVPFVSYIDQAWLFVLLVALMNFPGSIANISWQSFIGDLVPENRRATFFTDRNRILTIASMMVTFVVGVALEQFDQTKAYPFQILFFIAFLFGVIEVSYLLKHEEIKREQVKKKVKFSLAVFKYKPYILYVICGLFFNFGWQMAWPLFNIYQIKYANATALWLSLFTVANQIAQILSFKWWGRMSDRHGNDKMLVVASLGMASAPFLTILSTNLVYLVFVNLFTGLFVAGITTLLFNQLLNVTKEDNRTTYIANYNFLLSTIAFIAPQAGVFLLNAYSIEVAMTLSSIVRFLGGVLFFVVLKKSVAKVLRNKGE